MNMSTDDKTELTLTYQIHQKYLNVFCSCFIPELVESLLVSLKHVPHVEAQGVGCVPLLQLLKVGVLSKSHAVQRGGLAVLHCAQLSWLSATEQVRERAF